LSADAILYACASRDEKKSKAFAQLYGATKYFGDYESMVRCAEVDIIYIATPHSFHYEHSLLCMHNGKHVLCEKPMGINEQQVLSMIETAVSQKVLLMEAMWTAFLPTILDIKDTIASGAVGDIRYMTADFGFKADYNPKSRLFDPHLAGGSLLDIGIYPLYMALLVLGMPQSVNAVGDFADTGVDTECTIMLSYQHGQSASLYSSITSHTDTKCEIYGTKGKILIPRRFHEADHYILTKTDQSPIKCEVGRVGLGYFHEITHAHYCLSHQLIESPIMDHQTSINLVKLMGQIAVEMKSAN
jgi:predicted dehydrogenase